MSSSFYRSILSTVLRDKVLLSSVDSLEHDLDELARKITHLLNVANLGHIFIDLTAQFGEAPPVLYDESSVVNIIALPIGEFETVIPRCRWVLWYGREIYHGHRTGKDMLLATPYYWTPLYGRFTPKLSSLIVEKYFENIIPRAVGVIRGLELYCPLEYPRDIILATIFSMFYNSLYIPYERNSPEKTWESLREHLKMYEKVSNIPIMFYYLSFNSRAPEFTLTRTMGWDELIYELRKFLGRYVLEGHYPPPYIVLPEGCLVLSPLGGIYRIYPSRDYMLSRVCTSPPDETILLTPSGDKIILKEPATSITVPSILTGEPVRVDLYKYRNIVFPLY